MAAGELTIARDDRGDLVVLALAGRARPRAARTSCWPTRRASRSAASSCSTSRRCAGSTPTALRALTNLDVRSRVERWSLALTGVRPQVAGVLADAGLDQRIDVREAAP